MFWLEWPPPQQCCRCAGHGVNIHTSLAGRVNGHDGGVEGESRVRDRILLTGVQKRKS
jgi:hypothetical protein